MVYAPVESFGINLLKAEIRLPEMSTCKDALRYETLGFMLGVLLYCILYPKPKSKWFLYASRTKGFVKDSIN